MIVSSFLFRNGKIEKENNPHSALLNDYKLVLGFGKKEILANENDFNKIKTMFPNAEIALCSTAGEICNSETYDDTIVLTAISFSKTTFKTTMVNISSFKNSFEAGAKLIENLNNKELRNVFILSDGSSVNGSELVRGIDSVIEQTIPVTGGLAGDGTKFESTLVGLNQLPGNGNIIGIGFYGEHLKISHGTMGGWEMFGLEKTVTKSVSNVVFEIDNKNALELYKSYLGKYAEDLPGSALLFPLYVQLPNSDVSVVRTILSINNVDNSMVFAGDVPTGSKVRFMRANFDNLIDAASVAAQNSLTNFGEGAPKLAILISCVGRKIILAKRVDEEVEAVCEILGKDIITTGFYSYGEISPLKIDSSCQLHNQTMTITTFDEN